MTFKHRDEQQELSEITAWMHELASAPLDAGAMPDPSLIWWKAQLLRRWDAERQATQPIEVGERVQVGIGVGGGLLLLATIWRAMPSSSSPSMTAIVIITGVLLATVAAFTAWGALARD